MLGHPLKNQSARVTSKFGPRVLRGVAQHHNGIDYGIVSGTPVYSTLDGEIVKTAYEKGGAGYYVVIKHSNVKGIIDDDGVIYSVYMHLSKDSFKVKVGDKVKQGQEIGLSGNSGASTGAHLHFEVRANRYSGAFDPLPFIK